MITHPATGLPLGEAAGACGACAWRDDGRCLFAARGVEDGPFVAEDDPACAYFEAPVGCDPCGACCREAFDSVPVDDDDARRLGPEHAGLIQHHADGWRDLRRVPSPTGCGTRCAALGGDGAADRPYRCAVYALRPTNCRDLAPGSEACLTARRRVGLTPWAPGQSADGPLAVPRC